MNKLLLSLTLCFALLGAAMAQPISTEKGKRSDEIFLKLRKIDLLNQILPLILTKEQINKLLVPIEQARAKQKQVLASEDEELAKLQSRIDETYDKAIVKGEYPSKDFSSAIAAKTREMSIKRQIALAEMVESLQKVVDSVLNEGQKKAMLGSFTPGFIDPSKKPEEISDAVKMRFFVERVLLDPLTREILIEISDKKKD